MIAAMNSKAKPPAKGEDGIDEARLARQRMEREMARLEGQGEKMLGADGHLRGAEPPEDNIELWGRRIGRTLGYAVAFYLIWHLLSTYVFK